MATPLLHRSKGLLAPIVVCILTFFVLSSLLMHWMVGETLDGGGNLLQQSLDWQLLRRGQQPASRRMNRDRLKKQQLRQEYDQRYPINESRTRVFVESLRKHSLNTVSVDMEYNILDCPLDPPQDYPHEWSVLDVLKNWNPDNTSVPHSIYQGLCIFDYVRDYEKALRYRNMELPFVVQNTPELWQTAERWNREKYLLHLLQDDALNKVEHSHNNHFMYWKDKYPRNHIDRDWKPPTDMTTLSFEEWLDKTNNNSTNDWYYFRYNAIWEQQHIFLYDELPFFRPHKPGFFMVDPHQQRGINCRFGMALGARGIIAEAHYDSSRNFIVLLGGSRRYILAHPRECLHLELYPMEHPSGRHSAVDWTDFVVDEHPLFAQARVNEVVLQAGDALYLPTHWFHFIQSLDRNLQCNARSGTTLNYVKHIRDCGFKQ